jgi:uncharacterized protein (DUF1778 family)
MDAENSARRKTMSFTFRVTTSDKALIEEAARLSGSDATQFVMAPAIERARALSERSQVTVLTDESRKLFSALMLDPPEPSERFIRNMRDSRHEIVD